MKITIETKSANLLMEISKILREKNNKDKISEVLDLLKTNNINWFVEDYSIEDETVTISFKVG